MILIFIIDTLLRLFISDLLMFFYTLSDMEVGEEADINWFAMVSCIEVCTLVRRNCGLV